MGGQSKQETTHRTVPDFPDLAFQTSLQKLHLVFAKNTRKNFRDIWGAAEILWCTLWVELWSWARRGDLLEVTSRFTASRREQELSQIVRGTLFCGSPQCVDFTSFSALHHIYFTSLFGFVCWPCTTMSCKESDWGTKNGGVQHRQKNCVHSLLLELPWFKCCWLESGELKNILLWYDWQ